MNTEDKLKSLFTDDNDLPSQFDQEDRIEKAIKRGRTSLGQQQTMSFMLIKIWVAVAKILAPLFAGMAKKQASARMQQAKKSHNQHKQAGEH